MEEFQEQNVATEPVITDNPDTTALQNEGQAQSAPSELILGKFKSVDELSKAYKELQKHQGAQSQELGELRQHSAMLNNINELWNREKEIQEAREELTGISQKYNKPEYFQDPSFREIYKEAFVALGKKLDTDRFINLLENYVSSRIFAKEKASSAKNETENAIGTMTFSKNNSSSLTPPKKRLDQMTPKEVDELLERLI